MSKKYEMRVPASLCCAIQADNPTQAFTGLGVEIDRYEKKGRGQSMILTCDTFEGVAAVVSELMYRWEERDGWDPSFRRESLYCGFVGEKLAAEFGVGPKDLRQYCGVPSKARIHQAILKSKFDFGTCKRCGNEDVVLEGECCFSGCEGIDK